MYGLGQYETGVLRSLPPRLREIVVEEVRDGDPESLRDMAELLQARDPAGMIAREYAREISETVAESARTPAGLFPEAGMGKSLKKKFKKAVKKIKDKVEHVVEKIEDVAKKVKEEAKEIGQKIQEKAKEIGGKVQEVAKKVARKAAPFLAVAAPWTLAIKSIRKGAAKWWKGPYGSIIITAVGAALAPFTGGASALAATLWSTGRKVYTAKVEAQKAKEAGKAEAAQMAAEVARQEEELRAQTDQIYRETQGPFLAIGITPERWEAMSVEARIGIIEYLSRGEVPPGYAIQQEVIDQAEAQGQDVTDESQVPGYIPRPSVPVSAPAPAPAPAPPSYAYAYGPAPSYPQATAPSYAWGAAPSEPVAPSTPEPATPAGRYTVVVEGRPFSGLTTLDAASRVADGESKPGDRVEIFLDGKSTGLQVRTSEGGLVSVPAEEEAKVRAMSHGEVQSMVEAAKNAAKKGGEAAGKGVPWWLIPVAAAAVFVVR